MIVQHQSDARKRPSITALATMWADQNMVRMLVSDVAAAAATSAGLGIENLLKTWAPARAEARRNMGIGAGSAPQMGRNLGLVGRRRDPSLSSRIKPLIGLRTRYPSEWRTAFGGRPTLHSPFATGHSQIAPPYPKRRSAVIVTPPRGIFRRHGGRLMGALEAFAWEWGSALIRWLHVTAAIAWIGGSFFFMHLDASLRKRAGDEGCDSTLCGLW